MRNSPAVSLLASCPPALLRASPGYGTKSQDAVSRREGEDCSWSYSVILRKGHPVTSLHSKIREPSGCLPLGSAESHPSNTQERTHAPRWHLPPLTPGHGKGTLPFQDTCVSLGTSCSLGIWQQQGKGEQEDKTPHYQSSEPLQSTPFIKSNSCQGKGACGRNVMMQQCERDT